MELKFGLNLSDRPRSALRGSRSDRKCSNTLALPRGFRPTSPRIMTTTFIVARANEAMLRRYVLLHCAPERTGRRTRSCNGVDAGFSWPNSDDAMGFDGAGQCDGGRH